MSKNSYVLLLACCLTFFNIQIEAQSFESKVNSTQVNTGKVIKVEFVAKNIKGEYDFPEFEPFKVVSGPNQMQSMQMINGEFSSETTYSFYLQAPEPGVYYIPSASLIGEEGVFETEQIEILVLAEDDVPIREDDYEDDQLKKLLKKKKVKKM